MSRAFSFAFALQRAAPPEEKETFVPEPTIPVGTRLEAS
jgi:hypothetical protein